MQKMLELVRNAKESDAGLVYHTAGVTRLLAFFAHWRFLYFHGQDSVRLIRHQLDYTGAKQDRTLLITSLSPVLFFTPESYLRLLEIVWVDGVVVGEAWRRLISRLLKEWEQLILSSTVMLSVYVGFLAIPGVVVSNLNSNITGTNQVSVFTSPAQIASCMSIVASAGSIVISLFLVRRSGPQQNVGPAGASAKHYKITHPIFGLEPLAIIFSLPWALVMMVTFFVALLLFCFGTSNTLTRIFVAVTSVVVVVLVGWCIQSTWGSIGTMGTWFSGLLSFISHWHALVSTRATCDRILALVDFRPHRESSSSPASDPANNVHSMPDRVVVGV
ncbi:hypothetical protein EDB89DRAFT_386276 [Lactarius sanguifluus]|nr:hypothetical protein EDB89DRAFT_386276 [Lactarius sanguifluus]